MHWCSLKKLFGEVKQNLQFLYKKSFLTQIFSKGSYQLESMYKSVQCDEAIILVLLLFSYLFWGAVRRYGYFILLAIFFSPKPASLSFSVEKYSVDRDGRFGGGTAVGFLPHKRYGGICGVRLCLVPPQPDFLQ